MTRTLLVLTLLPAVVLAADLPAEMKPLRTLESANGLLLDHAPSPRGPFWTAFGVLGFKPSTAFDEYRLSPRLQRQFPVLDQDDFFEQFTTNEEFYNALAAQHWAKLKRMAGGDPVRAAYGWHYGQTKLRKAQAEEVRSDEYAQKYERLARPLLASN
jgi:hypothetical protein